MKTIFVTLPVGLSVRNILFTGVLEKLTASGHVRVVAFTPIPDMAERYQGLNDNLVFEPLPAVPRYTPSRIINRMLSLRFQQINSDPALTSNKVKRKSLRATNPKQYLLDTVLSQPLPKSKILQRLLTAFHNRSANIPLTYQSLFDRYKPSLVFATNPHGMREYYFLKYAKLNGITTVGMIHSWDALTTEGCLVAPLDSYFVWNQVMKSELISIYGAHAAQIRLTGIPQFDVYAEPIPDERREEFFHQHGLDPAKLTVLFATSPGGLTPEEPEILAGLVDALNREYAGNVQVLVRIHQQDDVQRYASIKDSNVVFQIPGIQRQNLDDSRLMDQTDIRLLRDALAYSDLVINTASTITIDAVALDRPVINIAFDLHERNYHESVRRYFDWVHVQLIVKSGATRLAGSFDELVNLTSRYLAGPALEREERARFAESMCYKMDGKSADRISSFLLAALNAELVTNETAAADR
ncbi:MAG: CDP-glycerol glycerophosphotransferase family protein [SAR202 cluster bacterium]|nr:CDP-glycerol glycerophosphotransferase family protein [SAR202 cluster bacterium]